MILTLEDAFRLLRHYDIRCTDKKPASKSTYHLRAGKSSKHDRAVALSFGGVSAERESPVPELQAEAMLSELHAAHHEAVHATSGERMIAHVVVKASKVYEDEPAIVAITLALVATENHYEVFEASIEVSSHIKLPALPLPNKGHEGKGYQPAGRQ